MSPQRARPWWLVRTAWSQIMPGDTIICLQCGHQAAINWLVGLRDSGTAWEFTHDLAARLNNRVQLTTDGLNADLDGIIDNFSPYVDYAQLVNLYGDDPRLKAKQPSARYSPAHHHQIDGFSTQEKVPFIESARPD